MPKAQKRKAPVGSDFALPTTVGMRNHDPRLNQAPGYSFGARLEEKHKARAPGPHYKLESGLTPKGSGYSPAYSIGGRPRRTVWDSMMTKSPAPTTYNPSPRPNWEKAAPMYSFGVPLKSVKKTNVPAPNTYQIPGSIGPHVPDLKNGPATSIHGKVKGSKGFSYDFAKTPGPGTYNPVDLSHTNKRAPAATMKGRTKLPPLSTVTPGPAAYDLADVKHVNHSPRMRLKTHYGGDMRPPLFMLADAHSV